MASLATLVALRLPDLRFPAGAGRPEPAEPSSASSGTPGERAVGTPPEPA